MKEFEDYIYIEQNAEDKTPVWKVQIKKGKFKDCLLEFDPLFENKEKQHLGFTFTVIYAPNPKTQNTENKALQKIMAKILQNIIDEHLERQTNGEKT